MPRQKTSVILDRELWLAARAKAVRNQRSMSEIVEEGLRDYLNDPPAVAGGRVK